MSELTEAGANSSEGANSRLIQEANWTRSNSEDVLNAEFGNSNGATFSGQDQDAISGI